MPPPVTIIKDCRHGRMMFLPRDAYVGRALDLYGEYGEIEARTLAQLVGRGQTVVEAGANMGAHTVHLGQLVGPAGRVVAFEPQRAMFYILCANLALNDLFHVFAYRIAQGAAPAGAGVPLADVHRRAGNFGGIAVSDSGPGRWRCRSPQSTSSPCRRCICSARLMSREWRSKCCAGRARRSPVPYRPIICTENDRRQHSPAVIKRAD